MHKTVDAYLLELLNGTLVDSTALVDQVWKHVSLSSDADEYSESLRPVVVDLPESTWPITTTLMCAFSLLFIIASVEESTTWRYY